MSWINDHAWVLFAYEAVALFVAAGTLALHLRLTVIAPRHMILLSVGAVLAGAGSVLAGMQTGADPVIQPKVAIPIVRVLWVLAATCLMIECVAYLSFVGSGLGKSGRRRVEGGNVGTQGAELLDGGALLRQNFIDSQPPHDQIVTDKDKEGEKEEANTKEKEE